MNCRHLVKNPWIAPRAGIEHNAGTVAASAELDATFGNFPACIPEYVTSSARAVQNIGDDQTTDLTMASCCGGWWPETRRPLPLLYRRRHPAIYRFALHMSGNAAVAEDVTQEVFMTLIRDAKRFDPRAERWADFFSASRATICASAGSRTGDWCPSLAIADEFAMEHRGRRVQLQRRLRERGLRQWKRSLRGGNKLRDEFAPGRIHRPGAPGDCDLPENSAKWWSSASWKK